MQIETLNLGNNEHFIQLHQEVKICFIPFKLYSGQGFNTLDKNEIRPINKKIEEDLIKSYLVDGLKLLNVQNNRNVKFSKEKRKITDIPKTSIKTKKVVNSLNNNNNNCVEFKVQQDESIAIIAGNIQNLPVGCCTIEIMNPLNGQNLYIQNNGNPIRTIRTLLRTVTEYFTAGDANGISKWQVVQNEMIQHNIQEITVRVCPTN
jgi:hypothetical protein